MIEPKASQAGGRWSALVAAFLGWMFDGLEMGLFPLAGRPALREIIPAEALGSQPDKIVGVWFGYIVAAFLVGAAAGGLLFGWLGDRIGRVRAMIWSVLFYSIFSGLCGLVFDPWQLLGLRFIASLGMGGEWALGVALVMEIWPERARPLLAGLIGAAANVGFLLIALVGTGLNTLAGSVGEALGALVPQAWAAGLLRNDAWRMLFILGAVPALLTFFIRLFVPESERWREAAAGTAKTRAADIFRPGVRRQTALAVVLSGIALIGTWGSVQWIPTWVDQLTKGLPGARAAAQIWSGAGAVVSTILVAILAQKFNRRLVYFGLSLLSLAVCQFLFRSDLAYGTGLLFSVFLVGGMTAGFYGWIPLYLPELFPTRIRATGSGFGYNIGRILAAVGAVTSGQLVAVFGDYGKMCAVITLVYAAGLAVIWICPETKGRPLPE